MRKTLYSHTHKQPYALVCPDPATDLPRIRCIVYHVWARNLSYREAKHRANILIRKYQLPKDCEVVPAWRVILNPSEVYLNHYSQLFDMAYFLHNLKNDGLTNYHKDYYVILWGTKGPTKVTKKSFLSISNELFISTGA